MSAEADALRRVESGRAGFFFRKNPELLKELAAELLGISLESIETFNIKNPEMPPENLGDEFCRLDINMARNTKIHQYTQN